MNVFSSGSETGLRAEFTLVNILCFAFLLLYIYLFRESLPFWFHPGWTTDDALQQVYPFHELKYPGRFSDDLITEVMVGYLAPIHYWLCYFVTWLTGDPIMMSHWMMLIQIVVTALFLFLGVRSVSATAPAMLAIVWYLHSRHIVQRQTGGLPRGWSAVVICLVLFCMLKKKHSWVLLALFVGCLLHPPTTMVMALCYGLSLLYGSLFGEELSQTRKHLLRLILLSPIYIGTVFLVVQRPEHIGQMVNLEQASKMPEFRSPGGRFPFVPLREPLDEIEVFGFQAFVSRFFNPNKYWAETVIEKGKLLVFGEEMSWRLAMVIISGCIFGALLILSIVKKRRLLPPPILFFLISIFTVYFLSRPLAFRLYVPDRHLQFPLCFFFIFAFVVGLWRLGKVFADKEGDFSSTTLRSSWLSTLFLLLLGSLVYIGSGSGLQGWANFNYSLTKRGNVFIWLEKNTPPDSVIAGHPIFIDGTMLFAKRRAFMTNEAAHPFYPEYLKEVNRRLEISLRAHYAKSLQELVDVLDGEDIDYFVFERKKFYPEALEKATFLPPHDVLVQELTRGPVMEYAYRKLPTEVGLERYPFLVFRDKRSVVVDVQKLKEFLKNKDA